MNSPKMSGFGIIANAMMETMRKIDPARADQAVMNARHSDRARLYQLHPWAHVDDADPESRH